MYSLDYLILDFLWGSVRHPLKILPTPGKFCISGSTLGTSALLAGYLADQSFHIWSQQSSSRYSRQRTDPSLDYLSLDFLSHVNFKPNRQSQPPYNLKSLTVSSIYYGRRKESIIQYVQFHSGCLFQVAYTDYI